jgi:hypothetical protein
MGGPQDVLVLLLEETPEIPDHPPFTDTDPYLPVRPGGFRTTLWVHLFKSF